MTSKEMAKRKKTFTYSKSPAEDFEIEEGQWLTGSSCPYVVQSFLGEGAFGKVVKCMKVDTDQTFAVKIFKLGDDCIKELAMLTGLRELDPEKCNIVRFYENFVEGHYPCIVFEMLDISLHEFMQERLNVPLPLNDIRSVIQQLATALQALKSIGLIHSDLKPQNIMLVDHVRQPFRVKLIDFGCAQKSSEVECGMVLKTIWWRSPEIILGLPFSEAIDMWSLGCVMAELIVGRPLYPGTCDYDMICYIIRTHGQLPNHLLTAGENTSSFFCQEMQACQTVWKLKTKDEYMLQTGIEPRVMMWLIPNCLDDLEESIHPCDHNGNKEAERDCMYLMKRMLTLDPASRISPSEVLEHAFITRSHLEHDNSQTNTFEHRLLKRALRHSEAQRVQQASENKALREEMEAIRRVLVEVEAEKERLALEISVWRAENATLTTEELSSSQTKNPFKRMWKWITGKRKSKKKIGTTACLAQ